MSEITYALKKPCDNCPFRRGTSMRLHPGRITEIATTNAEFPCHKTFKHDEEGEGPIAGTNYAHCAGALLFREITGTPSQMMRIAERVGMYDAKALLESGHTEEVFHSLAEMRKAIRA